MADAEGSEAAQRKNSDLAEEASSLKSSSAIISVDNSPNIQENTKSSENSDSEKSEKLDELTSLEREIAELHHVKPSQAAIQKPNNNEQSKEQQLQQEQQESAQGNLSQLEQVSIEDVAAKATVQGQQTNEHNSETLEKEDLIAVLKGASDGEQQNISATDGAAIAIEDSNDAVGVTIEGEGEFQIMEIVDDEMEENAAPLPMSKSKFTTNNNNKNKNSNNNSNKQKKPKELTKEEERNLAMEQIQNLNTRKEQHQRNRRKQEIKVMPAEKNDLVSIIGADWSDDEASEEHAVTSPATAGKDSNKQSEISNNSNSNANAKIKATPIEESTSKPSTADVVEGNDKLKRLNSQPKITSVVVLKAASVDQSACNAKTDVDGKSKKIEPAATAAAVAATTQPAATTGFKRTRIIKRKIIWDPDAPETTFSYAQLVRPRYSDTTPSITKAKNNSSSLVAASSKKTVTAAGISLLKKESQAQKKARPATPKEKKTAVIKDKSNNINETKAQRAATPKLSNKSNNATTATGITTPTSLPHIKPMLERATISPIKRRSQTPTANNGSKVKRKFTEVDRLMSDEGAINMLNALENERQKKASENHDVPIPNMRSRSATISERFSKRELIPLKKEITPIATKAKRIQKPKASASWDYVYKQQANDDSMIIRRRSNSSYSSSTSLHRLSLDATPANSNKIPTKANKSQTTLKSQTNKAATSTKSTAQESVEQQNSNNSNNNSSLDAGKAFEFVKPESKSTQKSRKANKSPQATNPLATDMKKATNTNSSSSSSNIRPITPTILNQRRIASRSPALLDEKEKEKSATNIMPTKEENASNNGVVLVKRLGKVSQIIFSTNKAKIDFTFNSELLNNLVDTLQKLGADNDCNVVVMTTNAPNFCHGIDFSEVTSSGTIEKRKKAAAQLGTAVKNFLRTLGTFPKPLIAGVNGSNVGLGVTMLPLFDFVVASDKSCYETPYAKIGQVPEGYCLWNSFSKIRGNFKTKLFWLCEKLQSTESALSGLVNKLTAPNRINEESLATAKKIAALSVESYRSMKKLSMDTNASLYSSALDEEFKVIVEQWTTELCFENMKKIAQAGHW